MTTRKPGSMSKGPYSGRVPSPDGPCTANPPVKLSGVPRSVRGNLMTHGAGDAICGLLVRGSLCGQRQMGEDLSALALQV